MRKEQGSSNPYFFHFPAARGRAGNVTGVRVALTTSDYQLFNSVVVKYVLLLRNVVPLLLPFVVREQLLTEGKGRTFLSTYHY